MATEEDLVQWLKQKLHLEREALHQRHRLLLDEMEQKLHEGVAQGTRLAEEHILQDSSSIVERVVDEKNQKEEHTAGSDDSCPSTLDVLGDMTTPTSNTIKGNSSPSSQRVSGDLMCQQQSSKSVRSGRDSQAEPRNFLQRIVNNPRFEFASGIAIVLNTFILMFEIQYHGFDSGHSVGHNRYRPSTETWPGVKLLFLYLDIIFVCIFATELFVRIAANQLKSVYSFWIWFDAVIVITSVLSLVLDSGAGFDTTMIRVVRLGRMLRTVKMIRFVSTLDSLHLLVRSLQASVSTLCWSFCLLISMEFVVALCLSQMLQHYIQDDTKDISKRAEVFLYYGTFTRTMITMSEITLGNWVPSCRTLMENVSEWFGLFYILYNCCFAFAVIRVIQAVFIAETTKLVAGDDHIARTRHEREKEKTLKRLHDLFAELDLSGDGTLCREEWQDLHDDALLKQTMNVLEIVTDDVQGLFDLLDNGDGQIEITEFIYGLSRVKGAARAIDVVSALKLVQKLNNKVDSLMFKLTHTSVSPDSPRRDATGRSDSRLIDDGSRRAVLV